MEDLEKIHHLLLIPEVDEFNTLGIPKTINDTEKILRPIVEAQNKVPKGSTCGRLQ